MITTVAEKRIFDQKGMNSIWSVMLSPLYEVLAHYNYSIAKSIHQEVLHKIATEK